MWLTWSWSVEFLNAMSSGPMAALSSSYCESFSVYSLETWFIVLYYWFNSFSELALKLPFNITPTVGILLRLLRALLRLVSFLFPHIVPEGRLVRYVADYALWWGLLGRVVPGHGCWLDLRCINMLFLILSFWLSGIFFISKALIGHG